MLGHYVLAITTVIAVGIGLLIPRQKRLGRGPVITLLAISVVVVGCALTLQSTRSIEKALAGRRWPTVPGIVRQSMMTGERAIAPLIVYQYTVGDSQYVDSSTLQVPMFGGKRKKYEVARELTKQFPAESSIMVHYNPADPSQSDITGHIPWNLYGQLALGVLLFAAGLSVSVWSLRRGKKGEQTSTGAVATGK